MPKSNVRYWKAKITRNRERDEEVNAGLKKTGWRVVRIWEHIVYKDLSKSVARIVKYL